MTSPRNRLQTFYFVGEPSRKMRRDLSKKDPAKELAPESRNQGKNMMNQNLSNFKYIFHSHTIIIHAEFD
jgi:hypothetical protein